MLCQSWLVEGERHDGKRQGGEGEEVEPFKIRKCWLEENKSETNHIQNWAHFTTANQNKVSIRRGSWVENYEVAYKEEKS